MRRQRWFPSVVLAVSLFAINVLARLIAQIGFDDDQSAHNRATLVMFVLIALVLGGYAFVVSQGRRPSGWLPELAFGAVGGMLLTVLAGPLVTGDSPFGNGAGDFFAQIWLYSACAAVGTLLGYWIAVLLGRDYRSRSLAAYSQARITKPRRVVRR